MTAAITINEDNTSSKAIPKAIGDKTTRTTTIKNNNNHNNYPSGNPDREGRTVTNVGNLGGTLGEP